MEPFSLPVSDDVDLDSLISHLARPLEPADREVFRAAAMAALARVPCWGEGAAYRTVAALQRAYFRPPAHPQWDISQERDGQRGNKLIERE
jgi:hypothetical protein